MGPAVSSSVTFTAAAMTPEDRADANLLDSFRAHARWQTPCDVLEADGLLLVAGANRFPGPYKNCVVRVDPAVPAGEVLRRAHAFFDPRERKFTVQVRTGRDGDLKAQLLASGFEVKSSAPCMVVDAPVSVRPVGPDVRVERFDDLDRVRDAIGVSARAFASLGLAPEEAHEMLSQAHGLLEPDVSGFIAYRDAQPVATALTLFGDGHAGVYWVAVVPEARGRGLAEVCTAWATNAGFERGAPVVTLQASPMGLPVYAKMGYRVVDELERLRKA